MTDIKPRARVLKRPSRSWRGIIVTPAQWVVIFTNHAEGMTGEITFPTFRGAIDYAQRVTR